MSSSRSQGFKFVKLEVESFRGVMKAEVDFGPGLNVLHGPNDLGKSTLAHAIRCALLLPPRSKDASSLAPWHGEGCPSVKLTYTNDQGHYFRIRKRFGPERPEGRVLESRDGEQFTSLQEGNGAEEFVRKQLGWGIPAPGGKGGPKGLPSSFLTQVLLAEQTEVDKVLGEGLKDDPDGSGKLTLKRALSTLAEDPRVVAILNKAQSEVDEHFTPTGKLRGGKSSPFSDLRERLEKAQRQAQELREKKQQTDRQHEELERRADEHKLAVRSRDEAKEQLISLQKSLEQAQAYEKQAEKLQLAASEVEAIDRLEADVRQLKSASAKAQEDFQRAEQHATLAQQAVEAAQEAKQKAEAGLECLVGDEGSGEKALRETRLRSHLQEVQGQLGDLGHRVERAKDAQRVRQASQTAKKDLDTAVEVHRGAAERAGSLRAALERVDHLLRVRQLLERFERLDEANESASRGEQAHSKIERILAGQRELERQIEASQRRLRDSRVPEAATLDHVNKVAHDLELKRAAVSAGLQAQVERHEIVGVEFTSDDGPSSTETPAASPLTLQAERALRLRIGEAATLSLVAGKPEARQAFEDAHWAFERDVAPLLTHAGVDSVEDLNARFQDAQKLRESIQQARHRIEVESAQLDALRTQARELDSHRARAEALRLELAGEDREALEAEAAGAPDLEALRTERSTREKELSEAQTREATAASDLHHAQQQAEQKQSEAQSLLDALGADPDTLLEQLGEQRSTLQAKQQKLEAELSSLQATLAEERRRAEAELETARANLEQAKASLTQARTARDEASETKVELATQLRGKEEALASKDRAAVERRTAEEKAALDALPKPAEHVTPEIVKQAKDALEQAEQKLRGESDRYNQVKGALEQTGGKVIEEKLEFAEAEVQDLQAEQARKEIRARAFKLLAETIKEAREQSSNHLGAQLAAPLQKRFGQLTRNRYGRPEVGPELKTTGIEVAGKARAADLLSVGTREQFATLLRLLIAERLQFPIILDDHLVQADPSRLDWFRNLLLEVATRTQVIILTCRPQDYRPPMGSLPDPADTGTRWSEVDLQSKIIRWTPEGGNTGSYSDETNMAPSN
jgi:DNA repair exonuclease SbcCD ATPase subunit